MQDFHIGKPTIVELEFKGPAKKIFIVAPDADISIPTYEFDNNENGVKVPLNINAKGNWSIILSEYENELMPYTLSVS